MNFNLLVKYYLEELFKKYKLVIVDETKNYLEFRSGIADIVISYDNRENGGYLYVGIIDETLYQITTEMLDIFFNGNYKNYFIIPENSLNDFAINISSFLKKEGRTILNNESNILKKLDEYNKFKNRIGTENLFNEQTLVSINQYWNEKKYRKFLDEVELLKPNNIPDILKLKIKIARNKIDNTEKDM